MHDFVFMSMYLSSGVPVHMCLCMRCAQEQDAQHCVEVQMYFSVSVHALVFVCLFVCLSARRVCV